MKKFTLLFVSTLISCITLFASIEVNGIYYQLDSVNHTATIVKDTINGYQSLTEVVIPETITSEDVTYTVTAIGDDAFAGCTALTTVELPNTLEVIGYRAFEASGLTQITLPGSVTDIYLNAFSNCSAIESIKISDGITSVADMLFSSCAALTTLELGKDVQSIGMIAFMGSNALTEITCHAVVPPSVSMMVFASSIFESATLYVPAESIDAYKEASTWKDFLNIKAIGDTTITTPTITVIEVEGIFYKLNSEKYTATVVEDTINDYQTIVDLVIPETITHNEANYIVNNIGDGAFMGCPELTTIELPSTMETIGMAAFLNSPEIKTVTCHAVVPPTFTITFVDVFLDEVSATATLIVPEGSVEAYQEAPIWKYFTNITTIQNGSTTDLKNQTEEDVLIYSNGNTIYFEGLTTEYKIFNASGKLIYKGTETSLSLPKGSYIVRINNQVAKVVL